MYKSRALLVGKVMFIDLIGEVLFFPIWWYTVGFLKVGRWCFRRVFRKAEDIGFMIWIRNIFTPMYGQRSISGRLISIVMRSFVISVYSVFLALYTISFLALLACWVVLPVFIVFSILFQLGFREVVVI